jgi:hypothetical protein
MPACRRQALCDFEKGVIFLQEIYQLSRIKIRPLAPLRRLFFFFEDAEGFVGELIFYEFMDAPLIL